MTVTKTKATTKPAAPKAKVLSESIPELPANPFIFEILNLASKQRSNAKTVEVLKKYEHISLKSVFIWNFDESIISALPEGDVPYSAVNEQDSFKGTLSEKIVDAVEKIEELEAEKEKIEEEIKTLEPEITITPLPEEPKEEKIDGRNKIKCTLCGSKSGVFHKKGCCIKLHVRIL